MGASTVKRRSNIVLCHLTRAIYLRGPFRGYEFQSLSTTILDR